MVDGEIDSWSALYDDRYAGDVLLINNSRDALGEALLCLGYSLNTTDEQEIRRAYELVAERCGYPLHLGITHAGTARMGLVKSAIGIGSLLQQGIGDYHGPDTVGKLQASHHQIDRNHPSSKEHGKGGHKGKEATKGHILPRERICRQGGQHQVDAGSQHRI